MTHLSMKQKRLTDIANRFVVAKGRRVGGGTEWKVGIDSY